MIDKIHGSYYIGTMEEFLLEVVGAYYYHYHVTADEVEVWGGGGVGETA